MHDELTAVEQLESCSEAAPLSPLLTSFCERFMELLIDLLSQLPTRRFFKALLQVRPTANTHAHGSCCSVDSRECVCIVWMGAGPACGRALESE